MSKKRRNVQASLFNEPKKKKEVLDKDKKNSIGDIKKFISDTKTLFFNNKRSFVSRFILEPDVLCNCYNLMQTAYDYDVSSFKDTLLNIKEIVNGVAKNPVDLVIMHGDMQYELNRFISNTEIDTDFYISNIIIDKAYAEEFVQLGGKLC